MSDERDAMREALMVGQSVRDALTEHHAQPAPTLGDPHPYIHLNYGPWEPSGHQCGDIHPGGCDEPVDERKVTVQVNVPGNERLIGWELRDCLFCGPAVHLRNQVADAVLVFHGRKQPSVSDTALAYGTADAVLPVVEAALARARASCCEYGERTYSEMERHLTERAEQAERERDVAVVAADPFKIERVTSLVTASTRLIRTERDAERQNAEKAEATVQRVRDLAAQAEADPMRRWHVDFTGALPAATVPVASLLAALDLPEET